MSHKIRLRTALAGSAAAVGAALVVATVGLSPAGAAVGGGVLVIHGPGSIYAAPGDTVTSVTTPGGTAKYSVKIVNEGTQTGQFNLKLSAGGSGETVVLKSGATDITAVAESDSGYYSHVLAPGGSEILALSDKMPSASTPNTHSFGQLSLFDTGGVFLSVVRYETNIRATTGTDPADSYTSTTGSVPVRAETFLPSDTASEAVQPAHKASFTVKFQNDSAQPEQLRIDFGQFQPCDLNLAPFPAVVKVGTTDVTSQVLADTFVTPVLAHGHSITFTVQVSHPGPDVNLGGCGNEQDALLGVTLDNSHFSEANLLVDLAA